jgi:hypothetical protein
MANGIGSAEIVEAMGRAGMLGIFGAAGLPIAAVDAAIARLGRRLGPAAAYGFNLIHSPNEPDLEARSSRCTCAAGCGWSRRRPIST